MLIRAVQLCEMYSITRTTLHRWVEQGLRRHKVGGLVFFEKEDVDEFIRKGGKTDGEKTLASHN